jgi:polyisoprenoid-binding protein YceI
MLRPLVAATAVGVLALTLAASSAIAQPPRAAPMSSKDPAAAAAGDYKLDTNHTTVNARVGHMNTFSYSNFRFGTVSGTMSWDPARIENSKVDVTVETASIKTPVPKFAEELAGDKFLNSVKFPTAHFVSTSIKRTGPTTGQIIGEMTFMGQTKPMTINAEMVGAGKSMRGSPVVGFTGAARMKRSDFGFTANIPIISDDIELMIDTEFDKAG